MIRVAVTLGCLLCPAIANGTAMIEPERKSLVVAFENSDLLSIYCERPSTNCKLELVVNGKNFKYELEELGAEPQPIRGNLYSGTFSGRDAYFSFEVTVECPEDLSESVYCIAHGVVGNGELQDVRIREE